MTAVRSFTSSRSFFPSPFPEVAGGDSTAKEAAATRRKRWQKRWQEWEWKEKREKERDWVEDEAMAGRVNKVESRGEFWVGWDDRSDGVGFVKEY